MFVLLSGNFSVCAVVTGANIFGDKLISLMDFNKIVASVFVKRDLLLFKLIKDQIARRF